MRRMLIDNESSFDLMYLVTLREIRMQLEEINRKELPLVNFNKSMNVSTRTITLLVSLPGALVLTNVVVLVILSPYNIILGKLWLYRLQAKPSTLHRVIKERKDNNNKNKMNPFYFIFLILFVDFVFFWKTKSKEINKQ